MASAFRVKVEGVDGVLAALREADKRVAKKALRKGVTAGGQKVLVAMRSFARRSRKTGLLIRSLGKKIKAYPPGRMIAVIGPRTGYKTAGRGGQRVRALTALGAKFAAAGVSPTRYAHLVELGTSHSQAKPFERPAVTQEGKAAVRAIFDAVNEALASLTR